MLQMYRCVEAFLRKSAAYTSSIIKFSHRASTNRRISFSSRTAFLGSQVAPLRLHMRKATSMAFKRSKTRNLGIELKKVKKSTHPAQ